MILTRPLCLTLVRARSHLPVMFIGMQYLQLSNIKAAYEYLEASYAICQTDPLILNEMGVVNYYEEK